MKPASHEIYYLDFPVFTFNSRKQVTEIFQQRFQNSIEPLEHELYTPIYNQ